MIKGRQAVRRFDTVIAEIMEERLQSKAPHNDLLSLLFAYRSMEGDPLDPALIRDEIAFVFLAGHETTATTLMWALYLLDQHPEIQENVVSEIRSTLQGKNPNYQDVEKLPLTKAVFEETLRLYPPVHVYSREALGPDTLPCGQTVKKRDLITIPAYILHRHQEHWEDPHSFQPQRFLPENVEKIRRYTYIPFGAGPRLCLGKFFGLTEGVIILSMILHHYKLTLRPNHPVEPLGRMTLRPHRGLPMTLHRRD